MIINETITSAQNPRIKHLLALQQKSSLRRSEQRFVVEGRRELDHCLQAGYEVDSIFTCPELAREAPPLTSHFLRPFGSKRPSVERAPLTSPVSRQVYERIAYRGTTEGIVAVMRSRDVRLSDLQLPESPLIVVLESVEKPGNLGAILRSADAAGADAVVVCDPLTDLYNPNLIRSSIGARFTVPTVATTSDECIAWLRDKGIAILTAQLQDSSPYYDVDMRRPTAIVMGTESTGLTQPWRQAATAHIRIPMLGRLDSLNVSVSAAILLFEAVRQRQL